MEFLGGAQRGLNCLDENSGMVTLVISTFAIGAQGALANWPRTGCFDIEHKIVTSSGLGGDFLLSQYNLSFVGSHGGDSQR